MPVFNRERRIGGKVTHHREVGRDLDRLFEQMVVSGPANFVEEHSDDPQIRIKPRIARDHGRSRTGHGAPINDQQHRRVQQLGQFCGAPGFADRRAPVEQAHDALDDRDVRIGRRPEEHLPADFRPEHPAVEIAGQPTGHGRMMAGINEVRPHLEGLHPAAPRFQGRQERQRHGGFPDAAVRACNDQPW